MSAMNFFIVTALGFIFVYVFIKFIKSFPVIPDPWENEIDRDEIDKAEHEICLNCGADVKKGQYYCSKCNHATGKYVPYMPFVNIQFNYSMHQTMWRKLKSKKVGLMYKITAILLIAITAPIMIVAYLAIMIIKVVKYFLNNHR